MNALLLLMTTYTLGLYLLVVNRRVREREDYVAEQPEPPPSTQDTDVDHLAETVEDLPPLDAGFTQDLIERFHQRGERWPTRG